jgi:hypothetical protein
MIGVTVKQMLITVCCADQYEANHQIFATNWSNLARPKIDG